MNVRALLAAALATAAAALPATAYAAATPEFFTVPNGMGSGVGIAVDNAGDVWFNGNQTGGLPAPIWRLRTAQAVAGTSNGFEMFPTPGPNAPQLRGMAYHPASDRIWFVRSNGTYGYARTTEVSPGSSAGITVSGIASGMDLGGIAITPGGQAWVTEWSAYNAGDWPGNRLFTTGAGGSPHELPSLSDYTGTRDGSRYDAKPMGVTIAKDGSVWFTESDPGTPGYRIAKVKGEGYEEYPITPCESSSPCSGTYGGTGASSIAATPDGDLWFTNEVANAVFRFDPASEVMTRYRLTELEPTLYGGKPRSIRVAPDGTLWVAQFGFISYPAANAIIRIVPPANPADDPTADVYKLGSGKSPYAATPDGKGNVWFEGTGDGSGAFVGRLAGVTGAAPKPPGDPSGGGTPLPPPPPTTGGKTLKPAGVGISKVEDPKVGADKVSVRQICVGPPEDKCSLVYLLDAREYVTGFPGTRASSAAKKRKTRRVVVGKKTVTLKGGQSRTVTIKLNKKGRKILKRDGRLNATLRVDRKLASGKKKKLRTKKVVFKKRK